ncbi:HisA/HisF-related TIM barrel protein [Sulfobacillus harzensis]|uniref:1-(5-phosphoribosyl)-5-((5-phosphoribosylamino)methylideneamino)imidazole-4-carboxamide isomerase n=1 Tax=Sulfobacillus harzensis TaxID=2729629 RepID=A0A7Y0Q3X7_9FIRM|nr:HisA/HisF-related TIM barrel protein [Sulfobacillus harzensis]NMP24738.1 1-(5-phosphoribosyl)-5-((5-phosphoribosylamino)methylideneamino)imidazole-4-carboxamide isomerase [Sulfobacillus harzensis]
MEVWPALDLLEGQVVRLTGGDYQQKHVYSSDPLDLLFERFHGWPPRIHLVDLSGARTGTFSQLELARRLAQAGVVVEAGGGFRDLGTIAKALDAGVQRVVLGTRLVEDDSFRRQAIRIFGADAVVAGLDVRAGRLRIRAWKEEGTEALGFWDELRQEGWKRAEVTDVGRDGRLSGVDSDFWKPWAGRGDVGAGGGIRSLDDLCHLQAWGFGRAVVGKAWLENRIPIAAIEEGVC